MRDPTRIAPPSHDELVFSDGEPLESDRHVKQMTLAIESLEDHWRGRSDFYVAGNTFVYYSELQTKKNDFRGPDVYVVLGVERFRERDAWIAWEEGGRVPDVVIEIVSQSTEHVDRGPKMDLYARVWRARAYVIYDPFSHRLDAYELDAGSGRFRPLAAREDGAVPVPPLGLWLGVRELPYRETPGPWLRWIEGDQIVPTRAERVEAEREHAEAERARAEAERDRAVAGRAEAEARLRELEQELARLRRGS